MQAIDAAKADGTAAHSHTAPQNRAEHDSAHKPRTRRPTVTTAAGILRSLVRPAEYRTKGREHIFPSEGSLAWHMRTNRRRLVELRALYHVTGKDWIHPDRYDELLLQDGLALAVKQDD